MSDPTGTVGAPTTQPKSDLDMAFEGGSSFLERVQQMSQVRDDAKASLAALKLGNDIQAMRDATAREFATAQMERAQADEVLKQAQKDADALRAAAKVEAEGVVTASQQAATKTKQMAQAAKDDADAYAKAKKAEADDMLKESWSLQAAATEAKKVADEVTAQSTAAIASAKQAQRNAESLEEALQTKASRLHSVLAELSL